MGLYLGIFLVTLSGLMFEIGLTRIFSATIWYHFAFVAISVALLGWGLGGFALHLLRGRMAFSRERAALFTFLYGLSIPLALWLIVRRALPPRPAGLLLRRLARPLLPRRDRALDALRGGARDRGPALLRRPPRGLPRRPRRDVPPLLARRRERHPRGLARAPRRRRPLRPALPRPLRGGGAPRPRRDRRQRADGPLQDPQRSHEGPLPAHGGHPGLEDRAHRLERLLAHRRRDRLRVALSRPPLHRLRRVDEHPRVGRQRRQRRRTCASGTGRCPSRSRRRSRRRSSSAPAAARTCWWPSPRAPRRSPRSR